MSPAKIARGGGTVVMQIAVEITIPIASFHG